MTHPARQRRLLALLLLAPALFAYGLIHLKVNALHAEVVRAERQIVALEQRNLLLETEVLTRSNQAQLAAWNRVDFGLQTPEADQFIASERQLAAFGGPRGAGAPEPLRFAGTDPMEEAAPFPLEGGDEAAPVLARAGGQEGPVQIALVAAAVAPAPAGGRAAAGAQRVPLGATYAAGVTPR